MAPLLEVGKDNWTRATYDPQKKLNGHRYALAERIKEYYPKKDGDTVYNSLLSFFICQEAVHDRLESRVRDELKVPLSFYLASGVGGCTLDYTVKEQIDYFDNKKINLGKNSTTAVNELLDVYIRSMALTPPKMLEEITSKFYSWARSEALEFISHYPDERAKLQGKEVRILDATYLFDFESKDLPEKRFLETMQKFEQAERPNVSPYQRAEYNFISGHDHIKKEFQRIAEILKNKEFFLSFLPAKRLFSHYLLYGPPGTGKTTLVRSLADETGLFFKKVETAELGSKYYSETITNVDNLFKSAKHLVYSGKYPGVILFFDEFDHLGRKRGTTSSSEDDKIITTLNTWMDGGNFFEGLIVVGATNRKDQIDPSLLTRFRSLYVDYPKSPKEIIKIHRAIIQKMESYSGKKMFEEIDYGPILKFSQKDEIYKSGRVIEKILEKALKDKIHSQIGNPLLLVNAAEVYRAYEGYDLDGESEEKEEEPAGVELKLKI